MAKFPIGCEVATGIDPLSDTCPYSLVEIQESLFANHYRYALDEEPTTFDVSGPHAQRQDAETRYWLFEARDNALRRQWFVVIGTGKSPWNRYQRMKRWICSETNDDDLSPDQFLDEVWRKHHLPRGDQPFRD